MVLFFGGGDGGVVVVVEELGEGGVGVVVRVGRWWDVGSGDVVWDGGWGCWVGWLKGWWGRGVIVSGGMVVVVGIRRDGCVVVGGWWEWSELGWG